MNDHQLDRLLGTADPYAAAAFSDLHGADHALFEEIVAEDPGASQPASRPPHRTRSARSWRLPLAGALASAAVLTTALVVPAWVGSDGAPDSTPAAPPVTSEPPVVTAPVTYAAAVVEAARRQPRLLIGAAGWTVTDVYGFRADEGTIVFANGERQLEMTWYPDDAYDGYYEDRLDVSEPRPYSLDGRTGSEFRYSSKDLAVMLPPRDGSFVEIRTGTGGWKDRDDIVRVIDTIRGVSVTTWLKAMPPEIVTPARATEVVDELLTGVPLPPRFDRGALADLGTNDRYQLSAQVLERVVCGWTGELQRADEAGDAGASRAAREALASGREWPLLAPMDARGEYADGVRAVAEAAADGLTTLTIRERSGCP
ncbi:hypothetical protein [Mumia quercus]|uniref:hypothetical protein n=1 Tax=Mumia quercus TaxID=2976125 RepID=UPI0021D1279D|nr:hypothetical protein [Mumia quercus]